MASNSHSNRVFNVVPSVHDERDFFIVKDSFVQPEPAQPELLLSAGLSTVTASAPTLVCDLRPLFPPVYDQGDIGSCTAMAVCSVFQYNNGNDAALPSRLFNYYCSRSLQNNMLRDVGSTIKDATQALYQFGCCGEPLWPYITTKFAAQPPHVAYADASKQRIASYARVTISSDAIESALKAGHPVCIGVLLYESFVSPTTTRTGLVKYPNSKNEQLLGGHAIVIVGFDRSNAQNPVFIVRNSWGASWGNKGYCTFPYRYILDRSLAFDAWIILSGKQTTPAAGLRIINPRAL